MSFLEFDANDELFVSDKQLNEFVKDAAAMFMILASIKEESKVVLGELPVVGDFSKVFPNGISDLRWVAPTLKANFILTIKDSYFVWLLMVKSRNT